MDADDGGTAPGLAKERAAGLELGLNRDLGIMRLLC